MSVLSMLVKISQPPGAIADQNTTTNGRVIQLIYSTKLPIACPSPTGRFRTRTVIVRSWDEEGYSPSPLRFKLSCVGGAKDSPNINRQGATFYKNTYFPKMACLYVADQAHGPDCRLDKRTMKIFSSLLQSPHPKLGAIRQTSSVVVLHSAWMRRRKVSGPGHAVHRVLPTDGVANQIQRHVFGLDT